MRERVTRDGQYVTLVPGDGNFLSLCDFAGVTGERISDGAGFSAWAIGVRAAAAGITRIGTTGAARIGAGAATTGVAERDETDAAVQFMPGWRVAFPFVPFNDDVDADRLRFLARCFFERIECLRTRVGAAHVREGREIGRAHV